MTKVTYRRNFDTTSWATWVGQPIPVTELVEQTKRVISSEIDAILAEIETAGHSQMPGDLVEITLSHGPGGINYAIEVTNGIKEAK